MARPQPRLIVLPPSHYCERAQWGLDHRGLSFVEERWAAGIHVPLARYRASGTTLPILEDQNVTIQGSDRILDWAGLTGGDAALERRFETRIGPLVRQYLYAAILADPRSNIQTVLFDGVAPWQAAVGRLMWPVTRRLMISSMNARADLVPYLERDLAAELDWFEGRLGQTRYLTGDQFGRTDITAASLLAPLARPVECPIYARVALPPNIETVLRDWSARPSLQWVTRIYAEHRQSARTLR